MKEGMERDHSLISSSEIAFIKNVPRVAWRESGSYLPAISMGMRRCRSTTKVERKKEFVHLHICWWGPPDKFSLFHSIVAVQERDHQPVSIARSHRWSVSFW